MARREKVHWFGETTEGDRHPVMTMVKPGEAHESVTYVSRVLVFLFATDASCAEQLGNRIGRSLAFRS